MSFVIAMPDLVESAATDLAGIRSSLAEAAATAAGPTTGIATAAQDEVSIAIASMFGHFGRQFQAVSAQAQSFHQQFVSLMNTGAGAYASAEAANAAQTVLGNGGLGGFVSEEIHAGAQAISNAIASSPIGLGSLPTGGAAAPINALSSFGAKVAAPYQALVSNTATNLQAIGNTIVSNPFPFLHQLATNQIGYGQTIASSIATGIENLPAELANLPATIQTGIQGLATFNPGALLQQFVNNQIGYAQTIATGLQNAGTDLVTGLAGLPASFQAAGQALASGDLVGAATALGQGVENVFLPGFNIVVEPNGVLSIVPIGPLGDLAPIFAIPGQMAQNLTNLLPPGSIPAQIAQHATNLVEAFTNFGTTLNALTASLDFGIPLQLVLDAVGSPITALSALNSSAVAFGSAVQTGDGLGALAAVLDAPAVVANGFLNGTTYLTLPPASLFGFTSLTEIPFGGILTPLTIPEVFLDGQQLIIPNGTGIGGIIPGLLSFPAQLAQAIA
ncbi:hypothetical protein A5696_05595 [Mycobacterium sp. E2699]|uniref:PE family protein n=1 Tax=Mycobacterium sp. E2699 TaxID=1834137 RepID=UPI0007FB7D34|nr:PE family protein [Mycobacterium sp. E2699]OBH04134.1 hypothetical protein A5696_05595 [Mycobacterium sp. E2699]